MNWKFAAIAAGILIAAFVLARALDWLGDKVCEAAIPPDEPCGSDAQWTSDQLAALPRDVNPMTFNLGAPPPDRPAYQQRVVDEKRDLDERMLRLRRFFATDAFKALPDEHQRLMRAQHMVMTDLGCILGLRLRLWGITA